MLEEPGADRITTAALAAKLSVSEAALYRHFASKAQMFEGLIEFIETTLFSLVNRITTDTTDGVAQATQIVAVLLGFAEKNPGMTRVLIGDALVNEDERLQTRMNQLYDRIEAALRQSLKIAQDLNRITKIKIDVGSLAPIDITQTEVGIANAEQDIITAMSERTILSVQVAGIPGGVVLLNGAALDFAVLAEVHA